MELKAHKIQDLLSSQYKWLIMKYLRLFPLERYDLSWLLGPSTWTPYYMTHFRLF